LKKILGLLNNTSGMCPPLKTAVAGMLDIVNIAEVRFQPATMIAREYSQRDATDLCLE
jgi:hypothetical protein